MKIFQMFEEDTGNLLAIAIYAMEKIPYEIQEDLGITSSYLMKLSLLATQLSNDQTPQQNAEENERH
jgi:hypothetical protein